MTVFEQAARVPRNHPVLFHGATAILIVLLSYFIYSKTFKYSYLDWDDNTLVEQNVYVMSPGEKFPTADLWTPGRTPGPYLPLRTWSYLVDRTWDSFGGKAKTHEEKGNWHHINNTWLYIINGLLLFVLLRKLLDPWTASIATLIWVVHPIHVEGVSWVSGRKEMLAGILMVAACLFYLLSAEKRERAAPRLPWMIASIVLAFAGVGVLIRWIPIANYFQLGSASWKVGLAGLGLLLASAAVTGIEQKKDRFRVIGFSLLALWAGAFSLLAKPVAIMLPAMLIAWELGHRPLQGKATDWKGRPGTYGVLAVLVALFGAFAFLYIRHNPIPIAIVKGLVAGAAVFGIGMALERVKEARPRVAAFLARVPETEESLGMLVRALPFICLTLWGVGSIMEIASEGSVVKDATFNAKPKMRDVSAFAALWLDLYHLFVPLKLSALYDVKSDTWHWQAYLGVLILLATPIACVWTLWKSPKSLVWLAWLIAPIIPVSGIVPIAAAHADRYLYLPAIAIAVGLAYLLTTAALGTDEETSAWERWVAAGLTVAIIGGFTALSVQRVDVWKNDVLLWGDAVKNNPELPSARNNYGAALMNDGQVERALEQYYKAYEVLPTLDVAQFNIAATELRLNRPDKAQKYAEEFVAQHPEMPTGWMLLGQLYLKQMRNAEAAGNSVLREEKVKAAEQAYAKGCDAPVSITQPLQLQDKAAACGYHGTVLLTMGNTTGMEAAFAKGFEVSDRSKQLLDLRQRALREQKRYKEAHLVLVKQAEIYPSPENVRKVVNNLLVMDEKPQALEWMDRLLRMRGATPKDVTVRQMIEDAIKNNKPVEFPKAAVPGQDPAPIELPRAPAPNPGGAP